MPMAEPLNILALPSPSARGGRRPLDFSSEEVAYLETKASHECCIDLDKLTLRATFEGRSITWHFARYSRRSLSIDFMHIVESMFSRHYFSDSYHSFLSFRHCIGSLLSNIDKHDPSGFVNNTHDMGIEFINHLDRPHMTIAEWKRLNCLTISLRCARFFSKNLVSTNLVDGIAGDRLSYVSRHPKPRTSPRDAYSPYVADQIKNAANSEVHSVTERVRLGIRQLSEIRKKYSMAHGASDILTPTEASILQLSQSGCVDFAAFERSMASAGLSRVRLQHLRTINDFAAGEAEIAAEKFAKGYDQRCIEEDLGWPPLSLGHLLRNDAPFVQLVEAAEERELASIVDSIEAERNAWRTRYEIYLANRKEIERLKHEAVTRKGRYGTERWWSEQLARRIATLTSWREGEYPREKYGSVNFTPKAVEYWSDPDLGILPLRNLFSSNPIAARFKVQIHTLSDLIADLSSVYGRMFLFGAVPRLLKKIEILEAFVVDGLPEDRLAHFEFTLEHFKAWEDPSLGAESLGYVASTSTHPRYGYAIQWVERLIRGLRIQCRLRGILTRERLVGPRTAQEATRPPHVFGPLLCPTQDELTSFFAKLALMCQIDYGSLKNLKRDCLRNEANGKVDIVYVKRRPIPTSKSIRERDGSLETPGGLIRRVLELTDVASQALKQANHPDAGMLWLGYFNTGRFQRCTFSHPIYKPWWRFCDRHEVLRDDGARMHAIEPSRFRKTVKFIKYTKRHGDVYAIADDHTPAIARNHYANIPSADEYHDQAVDRALRRARDDAQVKVIQESDSVDAASELSELTGVSLDVCKSVLAGDEDSWLTSCLKFFDSPYGTPGEPCPIPFTACVHCENAVFTARKLPNLLRYRAWLSKRRAVCSDIEWQSLYAPTLARIDHQILPRFTPEQIAAAQTIVAEDPDSGPPFIPVEIREASF